MMNDDEQDGITAYHGSPHDFDQFQLDKIGTGEGAQAYGHGLYFAENEGVAKDYRDTLAPLGSRAVRGDTGAKGLAARLLDSGLTQQQAIDELEARKSYPHIQKGIQEQDPETLKFIEKLEEAKNHINNPAARGRMYQVRLKARPEHFLDWDAPLHQQPHIINALKSSKSKAVREILASEPFQNLENPRQVYGRDLEHISGQDLIRQLSYNMTGKPNHAKASQALAAAGIRGIRYFDAGSRSKGEGSRNYVVFDPQHIEVVRKYKRGGDVRPGKAEGGQSKQIVDQALQLTQQQPSTVLDAAKAVQQSPATQRYKTWDDVPVINPQDLVGKSVFPIFADLTKANADFTGIDSSQVAKPERLFGGPGYPLMPESQDAGLAWAVEGKGRGSAKVRKKADYVLVSAMMPDSHRSNASFSNALMKTMGAYAQGNRLAPEAVGAIDEMIRRPTEQKDLQNLQNFPGFAHPDAEQFLRGISFEQRKRVADILGSKEAQNLGAPNIDKLVRETLDPDFAGIPSRHGMFLMEIAPGSEDEQLVHLKSAGLPEHPSYQYGIKGKVVGKFHHPVAPEIMFKDWFDSANAEAAAKAARGEKTNVRRAFDLAMPTVTVTQEVADMLPRHPKDIQSGKAAKLALNAFNDRWQHTDMPVNAGGVGAADFSQALKNSDYSSTLSQYSPQEINAMKKEGKFTGYKLKDGEVYFGLKRGTNYADEYGFEHPELTPNETALVSVVNNEPGAKGIGGAPVVLKAIQEGATALDCYAVPSRKHPQGFLPSFYEHFGFKELGRVPFDPKYVTETQFDDMKHEWRKSGWNESMGLPSVVIMKWNGTDADRSDAVRRFVRQSGQSVRPGRNSADVDRSAGITEQGVEPPVGARGRSEQGVGRPDRGAIRTDRNPRPADRFARTLSEIASLSPIDAQHFGIDQSDIEAFKAGYKTKKIGGSIVDEALKLASKAVKRKGSY